MVEHLTTELAVSERLSRRKINWNVCYGWPIRHRAGAVKPGLSRREFQLPERKGQRIFSLPMYPHLKDEEVDTVIEVLRDVI